MSLTETEEYSAFGPWVLDVPDEARVPRLFRDHPIRFDCADIVLKVRRDIARRDANPAMDLYDALVIVDAGQVTLLERTGATFTTRSVPVPSIVSMTKSTDLLHGWFEMIVEGGEPMRFRFNGSSSEPIDRLMGVVRRLSAPSASEVQASTASVPLVATADLAALDEADYGLVSTWVPVLAREPELTLFGAHPSRVVRPLTGVLSKLLHSIRPMLLNGAIIGASPHEIHVVHRRDWLYRSTKEDVSSAHTVIFRSAGVVFSAEEHDRYENVHIVRVGKGAAQFTFQVPSSAVADRIAVSTPGLSFRRAWQWCCCSAHTSAGPDSLSPAYPRGQR